MSEQQQEQKQIVRCTTCNLVCDKVYSIELTIKGYEGPRAFESFEGCIRCFRKLVPEFRHFRNQRVAVGQNLKALQGQKPCCGGGG